MCTVCQLSPAAYPRDMSQAQRPAEVRLWLIPPARRASVFTNSALPCPPPRRAAALSPLRQVRSGRAAAPCHAVPCRAMPWGHAPPPDGAGRGGAWRGGFSRWLGRWRSGRGKSSYTNAGRPGGAGPGRSNVCRRCALPPHLENCMVDAGNMVGLRRMGLFLL